MASASLIHVWTIAATCVAAMAALSGCETVSRCVAGKTRIGALECQAEAGDKQAQFALGEAAELGVGGAPDPARAAVFYRQAASSMPDVRVVKGADGRTLAVRSNGQPGLPAAQYRLAQLYLDGRGVTRNRARALALLRAANKAGYARAGELLRSLGENAP
jgi:TPR repeat protein